MKSLKKGETLQFNTEKKKEYNAGSVMAFFAEILLFAEKIRSVYHRTGNSLLYLATGDKNTYYKEIDLSSEQFSEDLVEWFLNFKRDSAQVCKIQEYNSKIAKGQVVVYEKKEGLFTLKSSVKQDEKRLEQIETALEIAFLNEAVKQKFAELIREMRNIYMKHQVDTCLWRRADIFEYLNVYYEFLKFLMCENGLLEQKEIKDNVLTPLLQMGMLEQDKHEYMMTFQAPVILSAINVVYDRLNDFIRLDLHEGTKDTLCHEVQSVERDMYREIFLSKINQIFRYYFVLQAEGDLYQTRVSVYDSRSEEGGLVVSTAKLSNLVSFQGIRELRLGEKILFELTNAMKKRKKLLQDEYRIILVGEIEETPLEELIKYISDSLKRKGKRELLPSLKFIVHTYDTEETSGECCGYHYEFRKYIDFSANSQQLNALLEEGQCIFFLDNCQLYDLGVKEIRDFIIFKQSVSSDTYEEYFNKDRKKNNGLNLKCKFMDLYNALVMYLWKGKLGSLKKTAKAALMQYIKEYVKKSSEKAIYIYVSDIDAFKELNCIKEEFVRIEKYNQKEIGIIRFTTSKKEELPVYAKCKEDSQRNILVFNLWQFVKHILINEWEDMQTLYVNSAEYFLDNIYIGLDYTNWKSGINIYYSFSGANDKQKIYIQQTIEMLVEQLKYRENQNMYQRYIKNAFVSFLYGAAKSVEDLVFLHILKSHTDMLAQYIIKGEESEVEKHYNLNCKYSHKKNFWEAAELFDRDNVGIVDQYRVLDLEKNEDSDGKHSFLGKLAQACLNIGYEDSELYKRCIKYSS